MLKTFLTKRVQSTNKIDNNVQIEDEYSIVTKDPEVDMTPVEIIKRWNYPAEEHKVTTSLSSSS